ncbi:molybdopterin molybdotransferase MoeA [Marinobacter orientalis]|uniref:Molybdopterin molybdenumtransferase n=1 Tax=Marinobacter orientalis TaxID=1928859 RepID=A0A7Y0WRU8_9GAMM|nr:gephyrin-like molybdotransferase Glp [Marinobacter orientalis]NMT63237.1 molybdopterin molybdotransferase MoeA [Marinobacter orientalis]TGX51890.1 molybdopterin molybdotransferase MoeA [Marinobacter orientalis]
MASSDLIPVDDAINHLVARARPVAHTQTVPLADSLDRVLARDYTVPADVPPADNSAVDGYAVRAGDLAGEGPLPVSGRIAAGEAPDALKPGTAVRIFTGSEIPSGADSVIMQERVTVSDDGITINAPVSEGQNIRRRGQDLVQGELALAKGTRIRPQEMGLLGSIGVADVAVYAKLKVAILTTGDELVDPGQPLGPGQIYNSNRYTMLGLLAKAGCAVVLCETLKDTREATRSTLERAAAEADLIITSGGVSVGEEDHVRAVLEESGKLSLWRMASKPGKPMAFGTIADTPVLGLPGNPAAVLVTFLVVGMPFIRACQGRTGVTGPGERLPAAFSTEQPSVRRQYVRARKSMGDDGPVITAYPNQSSGVLSSACWADGLAVVPENETIGQGDPVTYYSFAELLE